MESSMKKENLVDKKMDKLKQVILEVNRDFYFNSDLVINEGINKQKREENSNVDDDDDDEDRCRIERLIFNRLFDLLVVILLFYIVYLAVIRYFK